MITKCFTNGTVNLQNVATQITYNICRIKPYKSDTKVEYYSTKNNSNSQLSQLIRLKLQFVF